MPAESIICKTPGKPLVHKDLTNTMYTRTPTFQTRHLKLAKTFPDNANQPIVDPYMIVVTQGAEAMFVDSLQEPGPKPAATRDHDGLLGQ